MNILIVSQEYPPIGGGGSNACMFLKSEYLRRGHKVTLVTARFKDQPLHERLSVTNLSLAADDPEAAMDIYRVRCKRKYKEHCTFTEMLDYVLKAIPVCSKLVKKEHFDVCMVFFGIPGGVAGWYLKKRYKLPYIVRFGGGDIPGFQERFKAVYKVLGPFVKQIWKEASGLVANSSGLRDFALNFCDKYRIDVITNGVDVASFSPGQRDEHDTSKEVRLLFVSRLIERKGLQFLIPHLSRIEKECERSVTLTVVGDGPYRETLEDMARSAGVQDKVFFEGQRDKKELPGYFARADIFVLPSMREGMPNVVLEAMAGGLPIVMSACEGSKELVDGNGYIAGDDFAATLIKAINEGKLREMGDLSKKRAGEIFSWENVAERYLELMEQAIEER